MVSKKLIDFEIDSNGCFNVVSHKGDKCGYTKIRMNGSEKIRTHRFIFEQCFGDIPKGYEVRHKCDNPKCINPEHLEIGTHKENMMDMIKRNRHKPAKNGVDNPKSRFTKEQVLNIYSRVHNGEGPYKLAKEFKVHPESIYNIKYKRTYKKILEGE